MADIGGYVSYDAEIPVEIKFPDTREPTGIVWYVTHPECEAAEALAAKHALEIQMERIAALSDTPADPKANAARREREKVAACVTRWDWGKWTFENGRVPNCDFDGVMEVLTKQKWFYSDPAKAINNMANFTKPVAKTSAKRSGSKSDTKRQTTKV